VPENARFARARARSLQQYRMTFPASREAFFELVAHYNDALWPWQLVALGAAMAAAALTTKGAAHSGRAVGALLALLWGWIGLAYHAGMLAGVHPAAPAFGAVCVLGALAFAWYGVRHDGFRFAAGAPFTGGAARARQLVGWGLVLVALFVYPMIGVALGQRFPAAISFGMPSPTTIYTIGLLVLAGPTLPRVLWAAPLLSVVIGTVSALTLGLVQDLLLPVAAVVALWVTGVTPVPPHSASAKP